MGVFFDGGEKIYLKIQIFLNKFFQNKFEIEDVEFRIYFEKVSHCPNIIFINHLFLTIVERYQRY